MSEKNKALFSVLQESFMDEIERIVPTPSILFFTRDVQSVKLIQRAKGIPTDIANMIFDRLKRLYPCLMQMDAAMAKIAEQMKSDAKRFRLMETRIFISEEDFSGTFAEIWFPFITDWLRAVRINWNEDNELLIERQHFRFLSRKLTNIMYAFIRAHFKGSFTIEREEYIIPTECEPKKFPDLCWSVVIGWPIEDVHQKIFKRSRLK